MSISGMNESIQQRIASHRAAVIPSRVTGKENATDGIQQPESGNRTEFSQLLQSHIKELRFSAHAATRMKSRNITMSPEMMGKLQKAVSGAADKGGRDSLILLENYAFIVNIPNRTVVTAMDGASMKKNVFTNIDSAVVAD
jgi:flagellar operon protein